MAKKLYFKIGEACRKLEIQPYVLRYWETEFPALSPEKSRSGQRTYGESDIRIIGRIKELLYEEGYTIAGAKKKLESELSSGKMPAAAPKPVADAKPATDKKKPAAKKEKAAEKPAIVAVEPKDPAPQPAATKKASPKASRAAAKGPKPAPEMPAPDPESSARITALEKGIGQALADARSILEILDSTPTSE